MYAVTGITGQVGGVVARTLLAAGKDVRAVVRAPAKAGAWVDAGCDQAVAQMDDAPALARAFAGAQGVFILLPSNFSPAPGFPESRRIIAAIREALDVARPGRVVCLSTIGAQAAEPNLLQQLGLLEQALGGLPMPVAFLRAAWFMENASWDIEAARTTGVIPSFLQPLDKPVPMVATADVGRVAAELLQHDGTGVQVVELEGPHRVAPDDIATELGRLLGRQVRMEAVPRDGWEAVFEAQGNVYPTPRARMLDGFNEGWIAFEGGQSQVRKGTVPLTTVLAGLLQRTAG